VSQEIDVKALYKKIAAKGFRVGDYARFELWYHPQASKSKPNPIKVRIMAIAEGYAMIRRKGAFPSVEPVKNLKPLQGDEAI
jgi:hypothetical protein